MKKFLNVSVAAIAMLAALVSCEKEASVADTDAPAKKQVTIKASIPEGGLETKVELSQDGSNKKLIKLAWETGDTIDINGETFTIKDATISGDGHSAEFTGTDPGAGPYTISYSDLPGSFTAQTQASDGDTDHLGYSVSLTGADDYQDVTFNSTWASAHSATLAQSSVLRLRALLPAAVASAVKKVIFKASENVFDGGKTLEVTLTTPGTSGSDNTLDVYATLPAGDIVLAADMDLLVQFQVSANAYDKYTAYRKIDSGTTFVQSGSSQYLGINCSNIASYANASTTNIGESTNPYLVGDQHQMEAISGELAAGETKYFKLVDDIDMTGVSWTKLNPEPFTKAVNFNGNNKKLSKLGASLFDDFNGTITDLTIEDATVSGGSAITGILANTIKTAASTVTNVDVISSSVTATAFTGGLIGEIDNVGGATMLTMTGCDISDTSVSGTLAGGVIGFANAKVSIGTSSYSDETITASARYAGGFVGSTGNYASTISNCYVENAVVTSTADRVGGFVGQEQTSVSISGCYVSGGTVHAGTINVGGFAGVGYGSISDSYVDGTTVESNNSTSKTEVGAGGFVGYFSGSLVNCTSNVSIDAVGIYIGGLVGNMVSSGTISKCSATGNITGDYRQVGGLVGGIQKAGTFSIQNSFAAGNVQANSYVGGLIGEVLSNITSVTISNCYSTGKVTSTSFGAGGLIGFVSAASVTISKCVAWNGLVTASSILSGNWSTGAIVGVAFPICTLTDNYRKPDMSLTAWWDLSDEGMDTYQHPNVETTTHPLVVKSISDGTLSETTAVSIASGQPNRPQYAYHGKVDAGKTLSQLASTTLGWSSSVWDFSGALPTLK